MASLPEWTFSGAIARTDDLSLLESELHAGRVAAAERGYLGEPSVIAVEEAMLAPGGDQLISPEEADAAGNPFVATHTRFVMTWDAQSADAQL